MLTPKGQYAYFEGLENLIKAGLAFYLVIFFSGITISVIGVERVGHYMKDLQLAVPIATALGILLLLFSLLYGINRISGLGKLHIWLDRNSFGFLEKSNEIIFHQLVTALEPQERDIATTLDTENRGTVAKSIFSRLASDTYLFQSLLRSGIFRYWIWYWITIYGTFLLTILAIESFVCALIWFDGYARSFFILTWSFSFLHLVVSLLLGYQLLRLTRQTVDTIVRSHRNEISVMLRSDLAKRQSAPTS